VEKLDYLEKDAFDITALCIKRTLLNREFENQRSHRIGTYARKTLILICAVFFYRFYNKIPCNGAVKVRNALISLIKQLFSIQVLQHTFRRLYLTNATFSLNKNAKIIVYTYFNILMFENFKCYK